MRRLWFGLVLVAAVTALITSVVMFAGQVGRGLGATGASASVGGTAGVCGPGMMGGSQPMMGTVWLPANGAPVGSIAAARERAAVAAVGAGLRPGEVIWFDNGF